MRQLDFSKLVRVISKGKVTTLPPFALLVGIAINITIEIKINVVSRLLRDNCLMYKRGILR